MKITGNSHFSPDKGHTYVCFVLWLQFSLSDMASQHVELEAAKFLQKLIQDSKDEPSKLATKLYVVSTYFTYC